MAFLTTNSGHVRLSRLFLENNTFWLGRGTLPDSYSNKWTSSNVPSALTVLTTSNIIKTTLTTGDPLPKTPVYEVLSVTSSDNTVTYKAGTSYNLDNNSIVWVKNANQPTTGTSYKVTYRYVDEDITSLVSEVDTMRASVVSYCYPDNNGTIEAGGQHWSTSVEPTKYIYLFFKYPSDISLGTIIYQIGVFINRTISDTSTNKAVLSTDIVDNGTLVFIDNISPFTQVDLVRQYVEIVLEF